MSLAALAVFTLFCLAGTAIVSAFSPAMECNRE